MGRVKNVAIKNLGKDMLKQHPEEKPSNFDEAKSFVTKNKKIESKRIRNMVAGYIANEARKGKKGS